MKDNSLKNIINRNTNYDTDVFVGIECINGRVRVSFPLGYRFYGDNDEDIRKDISLLIRTLTNNTEKRDSKYTRVNNVFDEVEEPIQSYIFIIQNYLSKGLYKEKEVTYIQNNSGKINWDRTIKRQQPAISNGNIYYLDLITKKNQIKNDELITQIHKYCVQVSFEKLWWLYLSYNPIKEKIELNDRLFRRVLNEKINSTFNDDSKLLFEHMLAIIERKSNNNDSIDYKYGTNSFEHVWEKMIDKTFGIKNKNIFFPKTSWYINGKQHNQTSLKPDTIMVNENNLYVLDAKYYKYGETKNVNSLPGTDSISKQIVYGEYAHNKVKNKYKNKINEVFNAFILPHDKTKYGKERFEYCGYATGDWKEGRNNSRYEYEKIQTILLDVKDLMELHGRSKEIQNELSDMIIQHSRKEEA